MNEELDPKNKPNQPQLQKSKIITPLNPNVRPEDPSNKVTSQSEATNSMPASSETQASQPLANTSGSPPTTNKPTQPSPQRQLPPDNTEPFSAKKYWASKTLRLLLAGLMGALVGSSYIYYLDGGENIIGKGIIALSNYSPTILLDTMITSIVVMVIYGLVLRFVLRSKHAIGQSVFAILATQLSVIILLGIKYFNNPEINIFGGIPVIWIISTAITGATIFTAANYMADRVWTWKLSRIGLATSILFILVLASFGLSRLISNRNVFKAADERAVSDQVKAQSEAGVYDFNADYPQYYPSDSIQTRFRVVRIYAPSLVETQDSEDYPHFIAMEFRDKNYKGTNDALTISMYQSKPAKSYNPPDNCGNPNPIDDYYAQEAGQGTYQDKCTKIKDIPGIGALYGRDEYQVANSEKVPNSYDWYYITYDNTLITFDTVSTLSGGEVVSILKGLELISPDELLTKSKALATKNH